MVRFPDGSGAFVMEIPSPAETGPVNPFDGHAANLEALADSIADGMNHISSSAQDTIPDDLVEGDIPESLIQHEVDLSNAGKLFILALRMQAEEWRKAGAALA